MKKSILSAALATALLGAGAASAAPIGAGTMIIGNGAAFVDPGTFTLTSGVYVGSVNGIGGSYIPTGPVNNTQFTTNSLGFASEFRMIGTDGQAGGGGEKSLVGIRDDGTLPENGDAGAQHWQVGPHPLIPGSGIVLSTDGDMTPGATNSSLGVVQGGLTNAVFFGQFFGFGGAYPWNIDVDYGLGTITIDTPSIEAQWGDQYFPMGMDDPNNQCNTDGQGCGIHFWGTIHNVVGNSFDFDLFGEHRVTPWEDTEGGTALAAGFAGWTAQFALQGHYSAAPSAIPVPAAVWLFGSGLLGLVGVARRKKA